MCSPEANDIGDAKVALPLAHFGATYGQYDW